MLRRSTLRATVIPLPAPNPPAKAATMAWACPTLPPGLCWASQACGPGTPAQASPMSPVSLGQSHSKLVPARPDHRPRRWLPRGITWGRERGHQVDSAPVWPLGVRTGCTPPPAEVDCVGRPPGPLRTSMDVGMSEGGAGARVPQPSPAGVLAPAGWQVPTGPGATFASGPLRLRLTRGEGARAGPWPDMVLPSPCVTASPTPSPSPAGTPIQRSKRPVDPPPGTPISSSPVLPDTDTPLSHSSSWPELFGCPCRKG